MLGGDQPNSGHEIMSSPCVFGRTATLLGASGWSAPDGQYAKVRGAATGVSGPRLDLLDHTDSGLVAVLSVGAGAELHPAPPAGPAAPA